MATEADLIQKFKDLDIPVGADFEELIHAAFAGANLADLVNNYDSRITTVENDLSTAKDSIQSNTDNKVTDNKNGTEQLNGVKVQPYNKLVDTIGGRNYLVNTQNPSKTNPVGFVNASPSIVGTETFSNGYIKLASFVSSTESETYYRFVAPSPTLMPLPSGTYTLVVDLTSSDNVYVTPRGQYSTDGTTAWHNMASPFWALSSTEKQFSYTFTLPPNTTGWYISLEMYADSNGKLDNTGKYFQFRNASIQKGNVATDSSPAPEDKADDSKVAHLSGANNFDTIPTVNNNPLLLASSLPSDLARTSQQTNFTAGLQSNGTAVATQTDVTTAVNTATENMADTTKATNFTAGLKSGGVDVATAADLKSVAGKAWHMKGLPNTPALKNISLLYQVDDTNKKMNIVLNGNYRSATAEDSTGLLIADFSDIIQGITSIIMENNTNKSGFLYYDQDMQQIPYVGNQVNIVFSGTKLYMNTGSNSYPILQISGADYLCLMYGSTISYTKLA